MSLHEQKTIKEKYYTEAMRYIHNAKDTLKKTGLEYNTFYKDAKYSRSASGIAYLGLLKALDGYLLLKGIVLNEKEISIETYRTHLAKIDKKVLSFLNGAYDALHLSGYYRGVTDKKIIQAGFVDAQFIIDKIKP